MEGEKGREGNQGGIAGVCVRVCVSVHVHACACVCVGGKVTGDD